MKRPQDAIAPLELAGEIHPDDGTPKGFLGEAFAEMRNFPLATEAYREALSRSPESAELWAKWADFDLERYRILALQLRSTQSGMAAALRVEAAVLGKGTQNREELLERSALADSQQSGIWGELGSEQLERGRLSEARVTLKKAQAEQPEDSWTLRLEARIDALNGEWEGAQKTLLKLGRRSPRLLSKELRSWPRELYSSTDVRGDIWNCLRQSSPDCLTKIVLPDEVGSENEEQLFAEQRWEKLAASPPAATEHTAAWFHRGVAQAELGDCEHAVYSLERGLDSGSERAAFWLQLCYASEAERAVEHLAALRDQSTVHRLRGDILVRVKEDANSATNEYEKAIQLRPGEPILRERLAQAYMSLGDLHIARLAAQDAMALNPNRPATLRLLASLAIEERDYSGALVFLNKLLSLSPKDLSARVQAGTACAQVGRLEQALQYLQSALSDGYTDERGAVHGTLAGVLHKLGHEEEARRAAEEAERLANHFQRGAQDGFDDHQ